jgi:hypothetical protein
MNRQLLLSSEALFNSRPFFEGNELDLSTSKKFVLAHTPSFTRSAATCTLARPSSKITAVRHQEGFNKYALIQKAQFAAKFISSQEKEFVQQYVEVVPKHLLSLNHNF